MNEAIPTKDPIFTKVLILILRLIFRILMYVFINRCHRWIQ